MESEKNVVVTTRVSEELRRELRSILVKKGVTVQDFLADFIASYVIEENRHDDKELTGIAATRAAIAEIRAGGGKTFDSVDDLMADLHNDDED